MVFRTYSLPVLVEPARAGATTEEYVAEEAILQGQVVKSGATDSSKVIPSDADGERVVGVALFDAAAGEMVTVVEEGALVRATSGTGTIAAGDPVASHGGTGEEGEVDTAVTGDYVLGIARKDDGGDGDNVEIRMTREGVM